MSNRPVHFQRDGAVDDGEAEHSDPAEQNTPERTRFEVHDEDLQRWSDTSCESNYRSAVDECSSTDNVLNMQLTSTQNL